MKELRRIRVGKFNLEKAITIEQIRDNQNNPSFWEQHLISIEDFFQEQETIFLSNQEINLFLHGVLLEKKGKDGIYQIRDLEGKFIGSGLLKSCRLKRDIIISK